MVLGYTSLEKRVELISFQCFFCKRLQTGATLSKSRHKYPAQGPRTSLDPPGSRCGSPPLAQGVAAPPGTRLAQGFVGPCSWRKPVFEQPHIYFIYVYINIIYIYIYTHIFTDSLPPTRHSWDRHFKCSPY